MNATCRRLALLAAVATTAVGVVVGAAGQASARICLDPSTGTSAPCPTRSGHEYAPPDTAPTQSVTDNTGWTLQWMALAAAVLAGLAIVAVLADLLGRRRWRQPPLEAALASSDPDELPRAAGLIGDRFAQHRHTHAAEHAYRAAIDADHEYWTPIAQIALANLLSNRGEHIEAQALLEAVAASDHPRALQAARSSLDELSTGRTSLGYPPEAYETLDDPASAHQPQAASVGPPPNAWR